MIRDSGFAFRDGGVLGTGDPFARAAHAIPARRKRAFRFPSFAHCILAHNNLTCAVRRRFGSMAASRIRLCKAYGMTRAVPLQLLNHTRHSSALSTAFSLLPYSYTCSFTYLVRAILHPNCFNKRAWPAASKSLRSFSAIDFDALATPCSILPLR